MIYEDINKRYGNYIAQRLQHELTAEEFATTDLAQITHTLEDRAEAAHRLYKQAVDDPLALTSQPAKNRKVDALYNKWRDAEDLSYLITIAESVYSNLTAAKA